MSEFMQFKPLAESSAEDNLNAFISLCRDKLTVFGTNLPFDSFVWDVTDHIQTRGNSGRKRIIFSSWETAKAHEPICMAEPFCAFAKSYLRYQQGFKPQVNLSAVLMHLRILLFALQKSGSSSILDVDGHVLNRAAQIAQENCSRVVAYQVGSHLQILSQFLSEARLLKVALAWKNFIKRPTDTQRVGQEFDERRKEKLPTAAELDAVAEAYGMAKDPGDVIAMSIAAIMCATPDRISEILTLRVDCEHIDHLPDGREVYGLKYWPAKGAEPMVKYVIPSMMDLVKDAVARIRQHTNSARALACWYESNPSKLFLSEPLEFLRGADLTLDQVDQILFGSSGDKSATISWLRYRKMWPSHARVASFLLPFSTLEKEVLSCLPARFPYLDTRLGIKYSEALCVVHPYTFNSQKNAIRYAFESVGHGHVATALGEGLAHGKSSVFTRLGILNPSGEAIKIKTHQFRHYLNTLAMHGGLSDLDIAKWSGRKDVRQNRAYDHVSARDKLALIREAVGDQSKMFGPLGLLPSIPSIVRDEFAKLKVMNAHTTEFGYCTHDYASTPCQKYLDCLNCNELVCIKGDATREANIHRQIEETRELLATTVKSAEDGAYGANRWVDHQTQTLKRLEELAAILKNPMIQHGAVIQLKHLQSVSRLVQAGETLGLDLANPVSRENEQRSTLGAPSGQSSLGEGAK